MKKNVKKQQKDILAAYLNDLRGLEVSKGADILEIIEQAKELKNMCFREILAGNTDIMKFFKDYSQLIIEAYQNLPEQSTSDDEKTTIEQAMQILNISYKS